MVLPGIPTMVLPGISTMVYTPPSRVYPAYTTLYGQSVHAVRVAGGVRRRSPGLKNENNMREEASPWAQALKSVTDVIPVRAGLLRLSG